MMTAEETKILQQIAASKSAAMRTFASLTAPTSPPENKKDQTVKTEPKQLRSKGYTDSLLIAICDKGPISTSEISDATGMPEETVRGTITGAIVRGLVCSSFAKAFEKKQYNLTEKGSRHPSLAGKSPKCAVSQQGQSPANGKGRYYKVMSIMRKGGEHTYREIAQIAGISLDDSSKAISKASSHGFVESIRLSENGLKIYSLTEKGRSSRSITNPSVPDVPPAIQPRPDSESSFVMHHPERGLMVVGSSIEEAGTVARTAALRYDCHVPVFHLVRVGTAAPVKSAAFVREMA